MADLTAHHPVTPSGTIVTRILMTFWNGLVSLGEHSSRAKALGEISKLSDADLERMGTTRLDLVTRTLSDGYQM